MPSPAKGLYAPLFVDLTFAIMGLGSAALLYYSSSFSAPHALIDANTSLTGVALLALALVTAVIACFTHKTDQRGWDDYMGQVVSQSALMAMVTIILTGTVFDFVVAPWLGISAPPMMIQGMVPIACLAWSIGYGFLRWRGTGA
jgi:hypothetical protein